MDTRHKAIGVFAKLLRYSGINAYTTDKQKQISSKMLLPVGTNPGISAIQV